MTPEPDENASRLTTLLDRVEQAENDGRVSVGAVLAGMGEATLAAPLLLLGLLWVSPLSGVPGSPTVFALLLFLIVVQILAGRHHLWLPGVLRRRSLPARRVRQALAMLRGPLERVEPFFRPRLTLLADRPGNILALLICLLIAALAPLMEILPFLVSGGALVVSCFAVGILMRDGLAMLVGYGTVLIGLVLLRWLAFG